MPRYGVVTMENHTIMGGLGTAVAEMMAEAGLAKRLVRIGLNDTYAHGGTRPYLMREYGLDAMALVWRIEELTGQSFAISEDDLAEVRFDDFHGEGQQEAL